MADDASQGDEQVKNSTAVAAETNVGDTAYQNFFNEISNERLRNSAQNGSSGNLESGKENPARSGGTFMESAAQAISNAASQGINQLDRIGEKIKQSGESIKDSIENGKIRDKIGELEKLLANPFEKKDGVKQLPTGDFLVREDGKESLFTPNGDRVTVNPDGSHSIKGDVKSVQTSKFGETTVTFKDGSQVSFDKEGILSVTRGNNSVSFGRFNKNGQHGGDNNHPPKPQPWPGNGDGPQPHPELPVPAPRPWPGGDGPQPHPELPQPAPRPWPGGDGPQPHPELPVPAPRPNPGDRNSLPNRKPDEGSQLRRLLESLPNIEIKKN